MATSQSNQQKTSTYCVKETNRALALFISLFFIPVCRAYRVIAPTVLDMSRLLIPLAILSVFRINTTCHYSHGIRKLRYDQVLLRL